jgi:hypothetical protein
VGRDSALSTATRYVIDGPGLESPRGRVFQHASKPALGSTQPPVQWVWVFIVGVERTVRDVDQPPLFGAEVKERV